MNKADLEEKLCTLEKTINEKQFEIRNLERELDEIKDRIVSGNRREANLLFPKLDEKEAIREFLCDEIYKITAYKNMVEMALKNKSRRLKGAKS